MRALQNIHLCLALTVVLTLRTSAQRNRYPNNNNQNSGGQSRQYGDKNNPEEEGKTY